MDEQKARFILNAGKPRPGDAEDASFQEAGRLAEENAKLGGWVEHQDELTHALHDKLNEIPVPPDLRDRILAGCSVSTRRARVRRRQWLAMAAGLALLLTGLIWQFLPARSSPGPTDFATLRQDMTLFLSGYFGLELYSKQLDKLQSHLADAEIPAFPVPAGLSEHPGIGCRVIDWHDRKVALICFSAEGEITHLLVTPKSRLPDAPGAERVTADIAGWSTASWSDEQFVYLTITRGDADQLRQLLDNPA